MLVALAILAVTQGSWEANPAFTKQVSLRWEAIPVITALEALSQQTGVPVVASPDVAQDRIILFVKDRPAKEVMRKIASHFKWEWRVVDGKTELYQTPIQKKQAEEALQNQILAPYREWRAHSQAVLKTKHDPKEEEQNLHELINKDIALNERYEVEYLGGGADSKRKWVLESNKVKSEIQRAASLLSPAWRFSHQAIANLTDKQLLEFESGLPLIVASNAKPLQIQIGREGLKDAQEFVSQLVQPKRQNEDPTYAFIRETALALRPRSEAFELGEVTNVRISLRRSNFSQGLKQAQIEPPTLVVVGDHQKIFSMQTLWGQSVIPAGNAQQGADIAVKDVLDKPMVISADLKSALEPGPDFARATVEAENEFFRADSETFHSAGVAKIATKVAETVGSDLIAHCYDGDKLGKVMIRNASTARLLYSDLCKQFGLKLEVDQGWIQLTDLTPELSRDSTIPSDLLRSTRNAYARSYSLDLAASALGRLSLRQARSRIVTDLSQQKGTMTVGIQEYLTVLQLWSSLTNAQKDTLRSKGELSASAMTSRQRELYLRQVRCQLMPVVAQIASIHKEDIEWFRQGWQGNGEEHLDSDTAVTEYMANSLTAQSTLSARFDSQTAVSYGKATSRFATGSLREVVSLKVFNPPLNSELKYRFGRFEAGHFLFRPMPGMSRAISAPGIGVEAETYTYDQIPKSILDEIVKIKSPP